VIEAQDVSAEDAGDALDAAESGAEGGDAPMRHVERRINNGTIVLFFGRLLHESKRVTSTFKCKFTLRADNEFRLK